MSYSRRARHWCFTLNNWNQQDEQQLEELSTSDAVVYAVWGYETSQSGTPHLQGYIVFAEQLRFNAARGLLPLGTHIEGARGTPTQASEYCKKDGLFKEFGTLPQTNQGQRSDIDKFKDWVSQEIIRINRSPTEREIAITWPSLYVRYRANILSLAEHLAPPVEYDRGELYEWQQQLYDILMSDPDDRVVIFIVNPDGGAGKTWFQRYMLTEHGDRCQVLSVGKRDDIAHALDVGKDTFMFNIPRGGMEFMPYTVLEQIKDKMVFSPKYCSKTKMWRKNNHVVVFCNEMPDMEKMSEDRYYIINL